MRLLSILSALLIFSGSALCASEIPSELHRWNADVLLAAAESDGESTSDFVIEQLLRQQAEIDQSHERAPILLAAADYIQSRIQSRPLTPELAALLIMNAKMEAYPVFDLQTSKRMLIELAPGNAFFAAALTSLPPCMLSEAERKTLIETASSSERYQPIYSDLVRELYARIRGAQAIETWPFTRETQRRHGTPDWIAFELATSQTASIALPRYMPLLDTCTHSVGQLRVQCASFFDLMYRDADTFIDRMIALSGLERLAETPALATAVSSKRRADQWALHHSSSLLAEVDEEEMAADDLDTELLRQAFLTAFLKGGEINAMRAVREAAGVPVQPPADWRFEEPTRHASGTPATRQ